MRVADGGLDDMFVRKGVVRQFRIQRPFLCPRFDAGMYGVPSEVSTEHQQDKTTIRFESNEMLLLLLLYMTFVL